MKKTLFRILSCMMVITIFVSGSVSASAASINAKSKPASSGITATYNNNIYNDVKLTINVKLNEKALSDKITVTVGSESKTVTPTTKANLSSQTAKVSFAALTFDPGTYTIKVKATNTKGSTTKKIGSVTIKTTYSVSNKVLNIKGTKMKEYKIGGKCSNNYYATINGKSINVGASQCFGYARYLQHKLYGVNSYSSLSKFTRIAQNVKPNETKLKKLIKEAGVGAHIRSGYGHSLVVIAIDSNSFTIADANFVGPLTIRTKKYTYKEYANSSLSSLKYIEFYSGK